MMKITILISIVLIGMAWCACDSCGAECVHACGTRRFRACCFNYLRRKRTDAEEIWTPNTEENQQNLMVPAMIIRYVPDDIISKIFGSNMLVPDQMQDRT